MATAPKAIAIATAVAGPSLPRVSRKARGFTTEFRSAARMIAPFLPKAAEPLRPERATGRIPRAPCDGVKPLLAPAGAGLSDQVLQRALFRDAILSALQARAGEGVAPSAALGLEIAFERRAPPRIAASAAPTRPSRGHRHAHRGLGPASRRLRLPGAHRPRAAEDLSQGQSAISCLSFSSSAALLCLAICFCSRAILFFLLFVQVEDAALGGPASGALGVVIVF
jgi:hypothetical protein